MRNSILYFLGNKIALLIDKKYKKTVNIILRTVKVEEMCIRDRIITYHKMTRVKRVEVYGM